jgi:hypothetical protein
MKSFKKITLSILFCTSIVSYSNAQLNDDDKELKVRFGAKAGFNYSNVYDSKGDDFDAKGKGGFAGGLFLSIPIGRILGFQPEVLFSQRGFKANGSFLTMPYELKRTSSYLDIPLLFSIRPTPFLSILVGPQYSYLLNQKDDFESSIFSYEVEEEFENDNIRKNTLCFVGGVDVNLGYFVIGARVGTDLINNRGDGTSSTPRYKNVWAQMTFGVRF